MQHATQQHDSLQPTCIQKPSTLHALLCTPFEVHVAPTLHMQQDWRSRGQWLLSHSTTCSSEACGTLAKGAQFIPTMHNSYPLCAAQRCKPHTNDLQCILQSLSSGKERAPNGTTLHPHHTGLAHTILIPWCSQLHQPLYSCSVELTTRPSIASSASRLWDSLKWISGAPSRQFTPTRGHALLLLITKR